MIRHSPSHSVAIRAAILCAACASACSYTFDDEQPDVTLVGQAPSTASLPRLNRAPSHGAYVVQGMDKAYWAAIFEEGNQLRLVRLSPPVDEVVLPGADHVYVRWRAFYLLDPSKDDRKPTVLSIVSAGQRSAPEMPFLLPPGEPSFLVINDGGNDDVFLYWVQKDDTKSFLVQHRDRSFMRSIPIPANVKPSSPYGTGGNYFFTSDGKRLVVRDGNGRFTAYSTTSEASTDLGVHPRDVFLDERRGGLVTIGDDGVALVPLGGGAARVLETRPVDPSYYTWDGNRVYYLVGGDLLRVGLDGKRAPELVQAGARRLLDIDDQGRVYYSRDSYGRWSAGAGDGWLGDWRFMERGIDERLSRDGKRVRWLEHAARPAGIGDLLSASIPGGAPLRLARNVRQYDELPDARVLAVENHAFTGTQARLVTIDETTREARWVADQAHDYQFIPGTGGKELLVDVVTGATGFDLVRVKVPAKP